MIMIMIKCAACALLAMQLLSLLTNTEAYGYYLGVGEYLQDGAQIIYNPNYPIGFTKYSIVMEHDCDFVFYDDDGYQLWWSGTAGKGTAGSCYVIMQDDCNLVIYPDSTSGPNGGEASLWDSGTAGQGAKCYFQVGQFDGIVMGALINDAGQIAFSTNAQFNPTTP